MLIRPARWPCRTSLSVGAIVSFTNSLLKPRLRAASIWACTRVTVSGPNQLATYPSDAMLARMSGGKLSNCQKAASADRPSIRSCHALDTVRRSRARTR